MFRKLLRALPWLAAIAGLAVVTLVVVRAVRWRPERTQKKAPPAWASQKSDDDPDLLKALELQDEGKDKEALGYFEKALAKDPNQWMAVAGKANSNEVLHRDKEAITDLRRLAALQPRSGEPWVRIGVIAMRLGDKAQAREAAERAVQLAPTMADPYLILSDLAAETDLAASVQHMEEYVRLAWSGGMATDEAARKRAEDATEGTYIARLVALQTSQTPEGPEQKVRAAIEARWRAIQKYLELAPSGTRYKTLEHLEAYMRLAAGFGDPDRARFAKVREMISRVKADIRYHELTPEVEPDAGAPAKP
jgi:tetratricopeptide (TPR) repeat protein